MHVHACTQKEREGEGEGEREGGDKRVRTHAHTNKPARANEGARGGQRKERVRGGVLTDR
jgi:hypothetical protein